jgi:hypothetical protein
LEDPSYQKGNGIAGSPFPARAKWTFAHNRNQLDLPPPVPFAQSQATLLVLAFPDKPLADRWSKRLSAHGVCDQQKESLPVEQVSSSAIAGCPQST